MKNVIIGICSVVLIGVLVLTIYTLHGRSIRKQELNRALTWGMENALEKLKEDSAYAPANNEELVALFLQEFLMEIDSKSKVTVNILDVDSKKGLLSAEAILTYSHPIGTTGKVSARETVILEQVNIAEAEEFCSLNYIVEGARYKTYNVKKGSTFMTPGAPSVEGKTFLGWRELQGEEIIRLIGRVVERDCTLVAVFH